MHGRAALGRGGALQTSSAFSSILFYRTCNSFSFGAIFNTWYRHTLDRNPMRIFCSQISVLVAMIVNRAGRSWLEKGCCRGRVTSLSSSPQLIDGPHLKAAINVHSGSRHLGTTIGLPS